ncbi:hypothetical protein ABZP36_013090 [Zizania latifolia]
MSICEKFYSGIEIKIAPGNLLIHGSTLREFGVVEKLPLHAATLPPFRLLCTYCKTHLFCEIFLEHWTVQRTLAAIFVDCFLPRPVNVPLFICTVSVSLRKEGNLSSINVA